MSRQFWVIGIMLVCGIGFIAPANAIQTFPSHSATEKSIGISARGIPIADGIGIKQGICVVLGDSQGQAAIELARRTDLLIYMQLPEAKSVTQARNAAEKAGLYGRRIFVEQGPLDQLYLADNVADAVLIQGDARKVSKSEVIRILCPGGKARYGDKELVKQFPKGVDDWTHPRHGPDNNPQSNDQIARAPYLTQFLADPRYGPLPQVAAAAAGRIFKAFGHLAFKVREEPLLNTLAAFNGYNGTMLWKRPIAEGYMVHRNCLIATPEKVYMGNDKCCQVIDATTGKLLDEIVIPVDVAGGTFWKWMALEDGVLYAVVGEQEQKDANVKQKRQVHGWPWDPISPGFNQPNQPWGYGRTVVAVDPKTKKVLWHHPETEPMDCRAVCMKNGRIYTFSFGNYLACLEAKNGKVIWRKTKDNDSKLFATIGDYSPRQDWRTNWRTTAYLQCSDQALYFAGPQINKLLAVSTKTGEILWENPYNNFQLILRDEGVYGFSGQIDKGHPSLKFASLTGEVLEKFKSGRRACTRPTGSIDAVFYRASGGSQRFDIATGRAQLVSPMRAQCHDGITVANGLLYFWPSVCDCNLTIYGITCLGPAGNFDFSQSAKGKKRLKKAKGNIRKVETLSISSSDWPTFRANNSCTATTKATVADTGKLLWTHKPQTAFIPTAPTAAGGMIFISGDDGIVRAVNVENGKEQWKMFTGGSVRIPPTIWNSRAFVGSGDGWVYALEAKTGRLLWRFRAAPVERRIPVYGKFMSTWPVGSGVLVDDDGTAYAAAGIVNFDGTHLYALNARNGKIKWQNNTSGHLDAESRSGVSVQGHMLLYRNTLCLAGGNAVSPALYDVSDGRCDNNPEDVKRFVQNNVRTSQRPRGWELYQIGEGVVACGRPFYAHPKYKVYDNSVFQKMLVTTVGERDIVWSNNTKVMCFEHTADQQRYMKAWGKLNVPGANSIWQFDCPESLALAVCQNAVVVAKADSLQVLNLTDGKVLWSKPLPAKPVEWGLAVNAQGKIIVTLDNGQVLCFG